MKQRAAKHKIVVGNFTSDPPVRVLNWATLTSVPARALQQPDFAHPPLERRWSGE